MALQDLTIMPSSRLGCPLSLKTPNMGNPGPDGAFSGGITVGGGQSPRASVRGVQRDVLGCGQGVGATGATAEGVVAHLPLLGEQPTAGSLQHHHRAMIQLPSSSFGWEALGGANDEFEPPTIMRQVCMPGYNHRLRERTCR